MKWDYDADSGWHYLTIGKRISINFINQWGQFLHPKRYNWITFTPVKLEVEYEGYSRMWDIEGYLMGFGFNFRYDYDFEHSEIKARGDEAYSEIMEREREKDAGS